MGKIQNIGLTETEGTDYKSAPAGNNSADAVLKTPSAFVERR